MLAPPLCATCKAHLVTDKQRGAAKAWRILAARILQCCFLKSAQVGDAGAKKLGMTTDKSHLGC